MKVVTVFAAVAAVVALVAGWLVGWVLPLVDGRAASFAVERADAQIDVVLRFKQYGGAYAYYELLWLGEAWMKVAYTLLAMGVLLAVLAAVGAALLSRGRKAVQV